jgi:AraC-like DNA-binding protein
MQSGCGHLAISQSLVLPGMEICPGKTGWLFLRVCAGHGYLLDGTERQEVKPGDLIVIPAVTKARVRASQLGNLRLCHFAVQPEQLTGFFTAFEQQALGGPAGPGTGAARVIGREEAAARLHANLCELRQRESGVVVRSAMLSLAVQALRNTLHDASNPGDAVRSPKEKLADLAARIPESELLSRTTSELARECGCTERHLRRLFAERFGAPLLQRQIQWRIEQAKQLLRQTDAKIIDIAGQCGFRGLNQFNATFKRLTRQTPSAWRKSATAAARQKRKLRSLCPRQAGDALLGKHPIVSPSLTTPNSTESEPTG